MKKRCFLLFPNFLDKAVTLSYDDGVRQDIRLIDIMKKNKLKGTFNLNSGLFSLVKDENYRRMTKEEVIETYKDSGMEIAVHGYKHFSLAEVDTSVATADVITDRIELEKMFGKVIKGMAYGNGSYSDSVVDVLKKCGINYSRTVVSTESFVIPEDWLRLPATCHHNNPRLMELAKEFLAPRTSTRFYANPPRLFYLWGHSYEFDDNKNWNVIEEFAELVGNRDDVWYATNGEVYEYVTAFDNLQFSADNTLVYNPSALTIYLNYFGTKIKVDAGETASLL
ncbi:MAG: polysaccharide deacetylase family protein [Clostridia bacterium]|nr:polysaccharide deacetylase family protein [Clostridia bacterium]